jgi:hypothetical protein
MSGYRVACATAWPCCADEHYICCLLQLGSQINLFFQVWGLS